MNKKDLNNEIGGQAVPVPQKSEVALREEEVLAFWNEKDIFNKTLEKESPNGNFVFYDGPPFATGLPHYGHILAGTIKDAIPRFWTMNGYHVARKWGWDCHGLPVENLIEKKLGLATKRDIEDYGVKNFNEAAREAVLEYRDDWKQIIPRLGRFADMDNDYRTMDASYTESVWWVFSELNKKGLVYEGFKSMHLCPRCGTTLSNFEVNQGYKDIKDIAVTVKLPLVDELDTSLLVWTTTPWTLPGNFAAAVHKDVVYSKVKVGEEFVILAKERLVQLGDIAYEVVEEFKGEKLVGRSYVPPFPFWQEREVENKENAWKIYHADYVEIGTEGTGAVHLAPAYGEEDMKLAQEHNIPIAHHVDESGHFMDFIEGFECRLVKPKDDDDAEITHLDADIEVVRALAAKGVLFKKENITHSYPHCWRCDTPLLNYATTSWFVRVTDIKDKLVAENNKVHWVPSHVGDNRFGRWLEGARDWAVSRQRYWGAPLPIWRNSTTKEYKIFGSLEELTSHTKKNENKYLVMRHAEAKSNVTGEIDAISDGTNPLTDAGRQQCLDVTESLKEKKVDLIFHSGMQRTRETAEILAKELGVSEDNVIEDVRITELQTGVNLEGKTWEDYESLYNNYEEKFTKNIEGIENRFDVQRRAGEFLYEIDRKYEGKTILVVGHASSTLALRAAAEGASMKRSIEMRKAGYLKNAEIIEVPFSPLPHNDNYELDFHRPYIDDYEVFDEDGTRMERVKDVFDCWFESGSMPYGQHHYPFENKERFTKELFPADFIAEGLDQTRGWFYSLIVLGEALFDESPYKNVIVNGLVLAEDGKKMSKKLQNYPDTIELVGRIGSDAIRYYLLSSSIIRGEDLNFSEKEATEQMRKNLGRLHNVLQMYEMFADGTEASGDSSNVLDRWIVARLNQLVNETTEGFKNYELDKATRPITDFIDDLSVWYLRRSRDRLKGQDTEDQKLALGTLRHTLQNLALVMAPSMPFYADYLWMRVKGEGTPESVHLASWPDMQEVDSVVLGEMSLVREFVTLALEARTKAGIKVRQPLQTLSLNIEMEPEYSSIIADEINVKEVVGDTSLTERIALDTNITPELKLEGDSRDFIRAVQEMRKAKGLAPSDRISLLVKATEEGKQVIKTFEAEIKRVVGADEITFGEVVGEETKVGNHSLVIEIQ
ncbi:class I tRNA ligase family protein [Candidatus Nomurabacteria bacterium]|nr:class I tRNA ligase family protein [Candidatus Nomurabacteria bacterium]